MKLHVLGIDLGKTVFHLVGLDSTGRVVIRKRCSRTQLLVFTANLQVQLIGMESCSGSHFLGRALRGKRGSHQVSHAHQVVGRASERKDPIHLQRSAMPHLT